MDDAAVRAAMIDAAGDEASQAVRERLCRELADTFRYTGNALWMSGYLFGPDRPAGVSPFGFGNDATVGLALVMQIGGELLAGAVMLLEAGNDYAAAALTRQIVEVEYLTWAFAEDEQEARSWMRASAQTRRRFWQPRHLRDRSAGRFREVDYAGHCERGGHPTPEASLLLPNHSAPHHPGFAWIDLATHGTSTWDYALAAADKLKDSNMLRSTSQAHALAAAILRWHEADRLRQLTIEHSARWRSP
jgi:hypothetical protein